MDSDVRFYLHLLDTTQESLWREAASIPGLGLRPRLSAAIEEYKQGLCIHPTHGCCRICFVEGLPSSGKTTFINAQNVIRLSDRSNEPQGKWDEAFKKWIATPVYARRWKTDIQEYNILTHRVAVALEKLASLITLLQRGSPREPAERCVYVESEWAAYYLWEAVDTVSVAFSPSETFLPRCRIVNLVLDLHRYALSALLSYHHQHCRWPPGETASMLILDHEVNWPEHVRERGGFDKDAYADKSTSIDIIESAWLSTVNVLLSMCDLRSARRVRFPFTIPARPELHQKKSGASYSIAFSSALPLVPCVYEAGSVEMSSVRMVSTEWRPKLVGESPIRLQIAHLFGELVRNLSSLQRAHFESSSKATSSRSDLVQYLLLAQRLFYQATSNETLHPALTRPLAELVFVEGLPCSGKTTYIRGEATRVPSPSTCSTVDAAVAARQAPASDFVCGAFEEDHSAWNDIGFSEWVALPVDVRRARPVYEHVAAAIQRLLIWVKDTIWPVCVATRDVDGVPFTGRILLENPLGSLLLYYPLDHSGCVLSGGMGYVDDAAIHAHAMVKDVALLMERMLTFACESYENRIHVRYIDQSFETCLSKVRARHGVDVNAYTNNLACVKTTRRFMSAFDSRMKLRDFGGIIPTPTFELVPSITPIVRSLLDDHLGRSIDGNEGEALSVLFENEQISAGALAAPAEATGRGFDEVDSTPGNSKPDKDAPTNTSEGK